MQRVQYNQRSIVFKWDDSLIIRMHCHFHILKRGVSRLLKAQLVRIKTLTPCNISKSQL